MSKPKPKEEATPPDLAKIAEPLQALRIPIDGLNLDPSNARRHPERNMEAIKASLAAFGQRSPIVVQRDGMIVRAGNGRLAAAKALGWRTIAAVVIDESSAEAVQFAIADNRTAELATWDQESLLELLDGMEEAERSLAGFSEDDIAAMLGAVGADGSGGAGSLSDRFGAPPFSVLDARQGYWKDRKRDWLAMGIESELGRGDNASPGGGLVPPATTRSGSAATAPGGRSDG